MLWLMWPVADSSSQRPGFVPTSGCVTSLMEQVLLGQVFLSVLRFYPVSIIPPMLHAHCPVSIIPPMLHAHYPVSIIPPMLHAHYPVSIIPPMLHAHYPVSIIPPMLDAHCPVSIIPPMLHAHSFFNHRRYVTSTVGTTPLSDSKVRNVRLLITKMYGLWMLLSSIQYPFLDICVSLELRAHLACRSTAHLSNRSSSGRPLITVRKLCRAVI